MNKTQYTQQSDEELMVQVMDHHSHPALVELHRRYSKKLLGYFIKMLHKDVDLAQDFVQDIFLKIMEKKHLYDPRKKFYTWLFTIASNSCKTAYRSHGRTISLQSENIVSPTNYGENLAEKKLFFETLQRSIDHLEHAHKTAFVLRYLEHFSLNEIAEITEVSVGTVKSRLFYATKKMTEQLKPFDPRFESTLFKLI